MQEKESNIGIQCRVSNPWDAPADWYLSKASVPTSLVSQELEMPISNPYPYKILIFPKDFEMILSYQWFSMILRVCSIEVLL